MKAYVGLGTKLADRTLAQTLKVCPSALQSRRGERRKKKRRKKKGRKKTTKMS
ncbi:hypothetical protein I79_010608 [Cricetulus griseus]|uniref:Uncharacterized protein n=1 Tax=Cricetulus griseus TaxID=10029 RepID=G3HIX7_CRIGR|nr:hypothetical protein I79_010608 [Cricetulus griseus]